MIFDQQQAIMFGGMIAYPDWAYANQAVVPPNETNVIRGTSTGTAQVIEGTLQGPEA